MEGGSQASDKEGEPQHVGVKSRLSSIGASARRRPMTAGVTRVEVSSTAAVSEEEAALLLLKKTLAGDKGGAEHRVCMCVPLLCVSLSCVLLCVCFVFDRRRGRG